MDSRVSTPTKTEQFSGTHKFVVSDAYRSLIKKIKEQQPPRTPPRKFRIRLNPNGTCSIRAVRDSDNQPKILPDNNLDLPEKVPPGSCSVLSSDCLRANQQPEPYSATSIDQPRHQPRRDRNGQYSGSLKVKKQEPEQRYCEGSLELKLEASKRKLQQQYQSIEDRRKRIKTVDFRDVPVPPEETHFYRRRPVVNIKRN